MHKALLLVGLLVFFLSSCTNSYTVTFESNGGTEIESITVEEGKTIAVPVVSRERYTLEGWYTSVNGGITLDEKWSFTNNTVTNHVTLFAKWNINQYTITFDTDGGSEISPITQYYNTEVIAPIEPTKEGYTFLRWDEEFPTTIPANDLTLTAQWQILNFEYTIIGSNLTIEGCNGCPTNLLIPNSIEDYTVTTIGDFAFSDNNLTSVTIPDSVTTIGDFAFDFLEVDIILGVNSHYKIEDDLLLSRDGKYLVAALESITSITIPSSVATIRDFAFSGNNLTSVTIPDSVTTIGDFAFTNNNLTDVTIPESVTTIGAFAFSGNNLTSVTIIGNETRFNYIWEYIGFPLVLQPES